MGKVFKDYTITATGDLGKSRTNDALKRWTESKGGKWASKVEAGVTHLVCSKDHWTRNVQAVQKAQELKCQIVTYDWLEDCIHKHARIKPKAYLCSNMFKLSAAKRAARAKKEKASMKGEGEYFFYLCLIWALYGF